MSPRSLEEIQEIRKAFEANPGITDLIDLKDGPALSMQYIDSTMVSIVSGDEDYKFLSQVPKRSVNQTLAEFNKQKSHGGGNYPRSFVGQSSEPGFADAYIKRMYDEMAYMAEGFEYNRVIDKTNNLEDPEVVQSGAAMNRLLQSLSKSLWHGNKAVHSLEFNGLVTKVSNKGANFVYDCRGELPPAQVVQDFAAKIRTRYFGLANFFYVPIGTKNLIDSQFVGNGQYVIQNNQAGPNGVTQSNSVEGILCNAAKGGKVLYDTDIWLDESNFDVPKETDRDTDEEVEMGLGENPPDAPTVSVVVSAGTPNSLFAAADAGIVRYRVVSIGDEGVSEASDEAHDTDEIAAGGSAALTITPGDATVRGFIIFRETSDGSDEYRKIKKIPRTAGATTTFTDLNGDLPGYASGVLGDFNSRGTTGDKRTLVLSELLKPLKTVFPPGVRSLRMNVGMVEYYSVLQVLSDEKFVVFKNMPTSPVAA